MAYRYQNIEVVKQDRLNEQYFINNIYPDIPIVEGDNYFITTAGNRLDLIAQDFYGDTGYWWVIASANALPGDSLFPPIGMQLRVPQNLQAAISAYKQININR